MKIKRGQQNCEFLSYWLNTSQSKHCSPYYLSFMTGASAELRHDSVSRLCLELFIVWAILIVHYWLWV